MAQSPYCICSIAARVYFSKESSCLTDCYKILRSVKKSQLLVNFGMICKFSNFVLELTHFLQYYSSLNVTVSLFEMKASSAQWGEILHKTPRKIQKVQKCLLIYSNNSLNIKEAISTLSALSAAILPHFPHLVRQKITVDQQTYLVL